jgi:dihydrofolate reductase
MKQVIEYTLLTADGVFESPMGWGYSDYRDDAYLRDGLGLLCACDAMLMGRTTYESFSKMWPGRAHPWADRINNIKKYIFSSKLEKVDWNNSIIVRGDVSAKVKELKEGEGGNLLVFGHTRLGEDLLKHKLLDLIDLSIHPLFLGHGRPFLREDQNFKLKLVATKSFSQIVKLTYEPQY